MERQSGLVLHSCLNHVEWFGIDPEYDEKPQPNFYHRNEVVRDGIIRWGCGR